MPLVAVLPLVAACTRGLSDATLPMGTKDKAPDGCHIDSYLDSRQRLSCVAYIDDVAPHGGGFLVCALPPLRSCDRREEREDQQSPLLARLHGNNLWFTVPDLT